MQDTAAPTSDRSMQAWLQATQMFTGRPARLRSISAGSARNGRAIEIRSSGVPARIASACASRLIRLLASTGSAPTAALTADATGTQCPGGTTACTVGVGDSCQPTPTFNASAPAAASARAYSDTVSRSVPPGSRSSPVIRITTGKSVPTAWRTTRTTATPNRIRRCGSPPHSSSRRLVSRGEELVDQVALGAHDLHRAEAQFTGMVRPRAKSSTIRLTPVADNVPR